MIDISDLADAIGSAAPDQTLRRRMGKVIAINSNYTINVQIAGSTKTVTGVRYFSHLAPPKVGSAVWLDTDGRDWICIGAVAGLMGGLPHCKVHRTSDYNIATGATYTAVPWSTAEYDPYGMFTSGTAVTVPITGRYLLHAEIQWTGNATSYRSAQLRVNGGGGSAFIQQDASSTNVLAQHLTTTKSMTAGDYVELIVRQNSGVTLALNATSAAQTHLTVTYLGPDA